MSAEVNSGLRPVLDMWSSSSHISCWGGEGRGGEGRGGEGRGGEGRGGEGRGGEGRGGEGRGGKTLIRLLTLAL